MEAVLLCSVGCLTAASVSFGAGADWGCVADGFERAAQWALGTVSAVGAQAGSLGLVPREFEESARCLLRALQIGGVRPFSGMSDQGLLGSAICIDLGCGLMGLAATGFIWALPVGAAVPWAALALHIRANERKRRAQIEAAAPQAFAGLAASLGSGLSLVQALSYVGAHVTGEMGREFMRAACSMRCGEPMGRALDGMIERLGVPGMEMVALSLEVSQRTGAPLGDLLGEAARSVGDRLELRRELDVKTAQARMSARVVTAMPFIMVAFLIVTSPDFRDGLRMPAGTASLVIALSLDLVAWIAIRKIMDVRI